MQKLYSKLYNKGYKSNIDNKLTNYKETKALLANKIKRNKYELYQEHEHLREVRSMNNRVSNCKSMQQRKKDNTDPIVNPTYFIKPGKDVENVTIDAYCKKVLGMNRPHTAFAPNAKEYRPISAKNEEQNEVPVNKLFGSVPSFSKPRPSTSNQRRTDYGGFGNSEDLPGCSFK